MLMLLVIQIMLFLDINNGILLQYGVYAYPNTYFNACGLTTYPLVFNGIYGIFTQCLTTGSVGSGNTHTNVAWAVGSAIYWDGTSAYGDYDLNTGFRLGSSSSIRNYYIALGY